MNVFPLCNGSRRLDTRCLINADSVVRVAHTMRGAVMAGGKHEDNRDRDGYKEGYDPSKTKDVNESGSDKHGREDSGDEGDRDDK